EGGARPQPDADVDVEVGFADVFGLLRAGEHVLRVTVLRRDEDALLVVLAVEVVLEDFALAPRRGGGGSARGVEVRVAAGVCGVLAGGRLSTLVFVRTAVNESSANPDGGRSGQAAPAMLERFGVG